jgi:hypothetical protein
MAWNSATNNLLAAGYGSRRAAGDAGSGGGGAADGTSTAAGSGTAAGGAGQGTGVSPFLQGGHGSMVGGQGGLDAAAGEVGAGGAAEADALGGCVALWSLKNQFFPVWSFTTKTGAPPGSLCPLPWLLTV